MVELLWEASFLTFFNSSFGTVLLQNWFLDFELKTFWENRKRNSKSVSSLIVVVVSFSMHNLYYNFPRSSLIGVVLMPIRSCITSTTIKTILHAIYSKVMVLNTPTIPMIGKTLRRWRFCVAVLLMEKCSIRKRPLVALGPALVWASSQAF